MPTHQFYVAPLDRPGDAPAKRAEISVTTPQGATTTFALTAGELRRLARVALKGLGYTKVVRPWHGKQATWETRIEKMVQPAMLMIEGIFPKSNGTTSPRRANSDAEIG